MARRAASMVYIGVAALGVLLGACGTPSAVRKPTPTATTPPIPTATPMPTSGAWHSATNWPAGASDVAFAPSAPQTGYLCAYRAPVPQSSSQWLYTTTTGGMNWTPVAGITTPAVTVPDTMSCSLFVDPSDAHDVFVQLLLLYNGPGDEGDASPASETLWRSQDGGTTWQQLRMPELFRGWAALTVVGTGIVALASYSQQVPPVCDPTGSSTVGPHKIDDLYASDDGGQIWNSIGQDLISKGLSIVSAGTSAAAPNLLGIGTSLFVQTFCAAQQGTVTSIQQTYWRSTDGGASWTALSLPAGMIDNMRFTPSPTGSFYGVAVVGTESSAGEQTASLLYSSDSGATWNALPALATLPGAPSSQLSAIAHNIIALPDGSVLADILVGSGASTAASEIFVVDPEDGTPTWQRYAPGKGEGLYYDGGWEIASASSELVLWGWVYGNGTSSPQPVYLAPVP